jgi:D-3-phosphoglycerate dehydrogenase
MFTVIQTDRGASDKIVEEGVFRSSGLDISFERHELESEDDVIRVCARADALIPAYAPLTSRVLDQLPDCRIVAFMATGYNSVDLDAATARGIVVTNVPDYCTQEVADHAMGFLLALGRNLLRHHSCVLDGQWDYEACGKPDRISHQSLGIIGLGRIGTAVAKRAHAFGLTVMASDPYVDEATMAAAGVGKAGLDEVLACDYVSLHCALTPETTGIIGADALAAMKPTAYLVNTARGACVDIEALTEALVDGGIAGAALDVLCPEPLPAGHPLYTQPNVIITPHTAFMSWVSEKEAREKACLEVVRALRGETPHYVRNPEVLERGGLRLTAPRLRPRP